MAQPFLPFLSRIFSPGKASLFALMAFLLAWGCNRPPETRVVRTEKQVLVLHTGDSVSEPWVKAMEAAAPGAGWKLTVTTDPAWLAEDTLRLFSAVALVGMKGEYATVTQQSDIQRYVQSGGALVALGSTISTRYVWPWLETALDQPVADSLVPAPVQVEPAADTEGPFLLKSFDGGRVLYPRFADPATQPDLVAGLASAVNEAIGNNSYDVARVSAPQAPRDNRFTRIVLDQGDMNEPMELTILPDGRVMYIERRGKMKMYHPETRQVSLMAEFDVCTEGNYEDGLLGLAADPYFNENHYIYLYYSPPCSIKSQFLSRFTMIGDSLIRSSEKLIMEVPVQRETCCHSGGSIAFGPDGCLYLSTGDNTSSKESDGYTPTDERPGRGPFDAQKSSGNANDLRGKVLRIIPHPFGGYTIPDGNLFPKNGKQGRPEIYTMGCRNPFRISVDPQTGWLYWGDVGPDVGVDGKYGPQSYDEFNQARQAGNFGWPFFVADNRAYRYRNFSNDSLGDYFDPAKPANFSPNNTGPNYLPPANPAFIWYPYAESDVFPHLGVGSRSAMAGPVFRRTPAHANSRTAFPDYYDGKWFIYEWARSWIRVVSFDTAGYVEKIEPFLPELELVKPIDMEFGPDGSMYLLEYGQNYFMKNPEARLIKIEYAAKNRLPSPQITVTETSGAAPFTLTLSAEKSVDYDLEDSLCFEWFFAPSPMPHSTEAVASFTYTKPGTYYPRLIVTDLYGDTAHAVVEIRVGNAPPAVQIALSGNQSFYFPGESRTYEVTVNDPEDAAKGDFDPRSAQIQFVYAAEGNDLEVALGGKDTRGNLKYARGLNLIQNSDCSSCHAMDVHSIGPSYQEVADKYKGDAGAVAYLSKKIITGGNGVWGEKIMAGHPQHTPEETAEMARFILSLAEKSSQMPAKGTLSLSEAAPHGAYLFAATYTDQGGGGFGPLTRRKTIVLRPPFLQAERSPLPFGVVVQPVMDGKEVGLVLNGLTPGVVLSYSGIDLSGIRAVSIRYLPQQGGTLTLRSGSETGPVLARWTTPPGSSEGGFRELQASLSVAGTHDLFLVVEGSGSDEAVLLLDGLKMFR
jgi:cytochrome c